MRKPSLAIIGTKGLPFVYSGYETFVRELTSRLKEKYEIHVYCHHALFRTRPRVVDGLRLHYLPGLETKLLTHPTHALTSTLHALFMNYDLYFYVNSANGPFGYLLRLLGRRTAINTDGLEWRRPQLQGLAAKYYYWASKHACRAFRVLVSDSQSMADVYRTEFSADSEVIAYGAHPWRPEEERAGIPWNLEKEGYYLVVGRLIPDNNADLIVEGFKRSQSRRKLVIVGDLLFADPYPHRIRKQASDQVLFTGFVRDNSLLRALYRNAYAYMHGHEYGGTNPTLLEGLATGSCVMALDTPFNREVLSGEEYGLLFPKDPAALARMIDRLERAPELVRNYRVRAPERIRAAYTWDQIAARYDALFRRLLDS
jgi:glycosyltransferase involved in cell wall biosynthesis